MNLIARILLNASVFLVMSEVLDGVAVTSFATAWWLAGAFGVMNMFAEPLLRALRVPIHVSSVAATAALINAVVIVVAVCLVPGFAVTRWTSGILAWLVMTVETAISSRVLRSPDSRRGQR